MKILAIIMLISMGVVSNAVAQSDKGNGMPSSPTSNVLESETVQMKLQREKTRLNFIVASLAPAQKN